VAMGAGIDMVFSLDVCCLMLLMWRFVLEVIDLIAREKASLSRGKLHTNSYVRRVTGN